MTEIEKEFVPYEEALALNELDFDEECLAEYFVFGDNVMRDGYYGQTEPQLFINGIGEQLEDKMEELEMFAYHDLSVPTFSQAFRFFREKHDLHIGICHAANGKFDCWTNNGNLLGNGSYSQFDTHEEAELACLRKLIEIVKEKENG